MKKLIVLASLIFTVYALEAQEHTDSLKQLIKAEVSQSMTDIKKDLTGLQNAIGQEKKKLKALEDSVNLLRSELSSGLQQIDTHVTSLDTGLGEANAELKGVKAEGEQSRKDLHQYLTYVLGGLCIILLLIMLVYWLSHRKHKTVQSDVADAKAHLQDQIKAANAEFAEKLLEAINALPKPSEDVAGVSSVDNQSLILDFAQQIASMENNIWHLPEDDRVRKRIERATKKMRDTFKSLGYEMPSLLGTEILEGQAVDIRNKTVDSDVEIGKRIVMLVVTPQVLFNGKTIKRPTVDIKVNSED